MLSRSASLDSIATVKNEYNDEEMLSRPSSLASLQERPIKFIKPKTTIDVKPKQALNAPLTAAAKAVLQNKNTKPKTKPAALDTPLASAVRSILTSKPNRPPTVSLSKSIDKSQVLLGKKQQQKKTEAAKVDKKVKQQEQVVKWQKKGEDVEMSIPIVMGKRKKDGSLQSETKTKKEN